jgi:hypothetical protein
MDVRGYNQEAWDRQVEGGNEWTVPVGPEVIEAARRGEWEVLANEHEAGPAGLVSRDERAPTSSASPPAAGSRPGLRCRGRQRDVLDNSPKQLAQDWLVAGRESLALETVQGDMRDLSIFADDSFDLVFHPFPTCSCPRSFRCGGRRSGCCGAGEFCSPVS